MRRRSDTIKADSFDEFFQLSVSQSPDCLVSDPSSLMESPYCYFPSNSDWLDEVQTFPDTKVKALQGYQKHYGMILETTEDDQEQEYFHTTTPSTDTGSMNCSAQNDSFFSSQNNSLSRFCKVDCGQKVKIHGEGEQGGLLYKVMIVGSMGTGRHTIIDSLFKEESKEKKGEPKLRNALDLLIRSRKEKGEVERFKFWIRDPSYQKFDPLIKVYYKSIDYYVFLYKACDKESLEAVEKAIQEVLNEVPETRFKGVLIGNSFGKTNDEKEIMTQEGEKIKEKYKLERFVKVEDLEKDFEAFKEEFMGFLKHD